MHLLAATPGSIDDGKEPVDLGQTPSDLVFISAADTELAGLAQARAEMAGAAGPASGQHDASRASDVGRSAYRQLRDEVPAGCGAGAGRRWILEIRGRAVCRPSARRGCAVGAAPGDDKPDAELRALSTVSDEDYDALWAYLVEGGPENCGRVPELCQGDDGRRRQARSRASPSARRCLLARCGRGGPCRRARNAWTDGAPLCPSSSIARWCRARG